MSKGSRPRPLSIPLEEFNNRIDTIFGEKPKKERWVPPPLPEYIKNPFEQQLEKDIPQGRT
jgi:hypothetical protein